MGIDRRGLILGAIGAVGLSGAGAIALGLQGGGSDATTAGDGSGSRTGGGSTSVQSGSPSPPDGSRGSGSDSGSGNEPGSTGEWERHSTERGSVSVNGPRALDFRVYRCNEARATRTFGTHTGTVEVSFDWSFEPDGWYEQPVVELLVDGDPVPLDVESGIRKEARTETSGTFEASAAVDGTVSLRIGLKPSSNCSASDHEHTRFSVEGLSVEFTDPGRTPTESDTTGQPSGGWTTRSTERGSVSVRGPGSVELEVFRCNRAVATRDVGTHDGTVTVSFDWTFEPDGWYEQPVVELLVDGDPVGLEVESGVRKEAGTETSGTFRASAAVDGPVSIRIGLEPSDNCSNPDHEHTKFAVRNLSVTST